MQEVLSNHLPQILDEQEKQKIAYSIVPRAMDEVFGYEQWDREKRPSKSGPGTTTWLVLKK